MSQISRPIPEGIAPDECVKLEGELEIGPGEVVEFFTGSSYGTHARIGVLTRGTGEKEEEISFGVAVGKNEIAITISTTMGKIGEGYGPIRIGRSGFSLHQDASREHLLLYVREGKLVAKDLNSTNGTFILKKYPDGAPDQELNSLEKEIEPDDVGAVAAARDSVKKDVKRKVHS